MITIPITVTGDHWLNPEQARISLAMANSHEPVMLDICSEGPSLHRLRVVDTVLELCAQQHRDPSTVYVTRWSNPVEIIPFQRALRSDFSHFYWTSERYRPDGCIQVSSTAKRFGCFIGRPTLPRMLLAQWLAARSDVLISRMGAGVIPQSHVGVNIDAEMFQDSAELRRWWASCGLRSLDGATVREQYDANKNTNRSLLEHYADFHVEIVAETYCYGETFFPTEKTVRPITAGKPMLIMGPKNFLRRLRDQGFRTWSELWDETYDDMEGPERLEAIKLVIDDLSGRWSEIQRHLSVHAEHNRLRVLEIAQQHGPGPH